jgi:hypothetical protein
MTLKTAVVEKPLIEKIWENMGGFLEFRTTQNHFGVFFFWGGGAGGTFL